MAEDSLNHFYDISLPFHSLIAYMEKGTPESLVGANKICSHSEEEVGENNFANKSHHIE